MAMSDLDFLAARLVKRLHEDIGLSKTREEHIRVTARANEALELLNNIRELMEAAS